MELHDVCEWEADVRVYHVVLTDQLIVTLMTDDDGFLVDSRLDIVSDLSCATGKTLVANSLRHVKESEISFSSAGCDLRKSFTRAIAPLELPVMRPRMLRDGRRRLNLMISRPTLTAS